MHSLKAFYRHADYNGNYSLMIKDNCLINNILRIYVSNYFSSLQLWSNGSMADEFLGQAIISNYSLMEGRHVVDLFGKGQETGQQRPGRLYIELHYYEDPTKA
jgi:hypothetical protein